MRPTFDPREHIRQLEDGRDYLDLKWRILWLRAQEPDASIESQIISTSEDEIICRTTISLRSGATVTAHGSATRADHDQPVEEAENRAMARALASLGFGVEYIDEDDVDVQPAPAPPVNLMTARALLERTHQPEPEEEPEEAFDEPEEAPEAEAAQPDRTAERPSSYEPAPAQRPAPVSATAREAEDISWTKFWAWAKPRGYGSAVELGELLNIDVLSHTPGEVRRMIKRYEMEHPPGEARE